MLEDRQPRAGGQSAELLPCPFCGSAFEMGREPHDNHLVAGMYYLYHDYGSLGSAARQCPLVIAKHFDTEADAITAWNTRHGDADRLQGSPACQP